MGRLRRWHLAATVLLLVGLHGAAWLAAAWHLRAALDALGQPQPGQNWRIERGAVRAAGWPLAAALEIEALRLTSADGRTVFRIPNTRTEIALSHPTLTRIALSGTITVEVDGVMAAEFTASRAEASVALIAPHEAMLAVRDMQARTAAGPSALARFDIRAVANPAARASEIALSLDASAEGIDFAGLAPVLRGPLGGRIATATLSATLSGPIDLRLPSPAQAARAWRNGGGVLTISELDLQWSRLDINLQASLGLDAALQPEGSGSVGAGGIAETLDRAVGEGLIPASSARAVKAVIGLMPKTPDGKISIPLTVKNQMLSAARFPLLRLPDLQWP